jgi:HlyD family secretion protein
LILVQQLPGIIHYKEFKGGIKMKGKLSKVIVICVAAAVVGVGGYFAYNALFGNKQTATTTQYYAASAKKMTLQVSIQGTGSANASVTKDVSPNNSGTLEDLSVKAGDTVTAGQKLFTADSDELRSNVTTAKNNLTKQNLTLSNDESAQMVDANKIAMDKIAVSDAQTQLKNANAKLSSMTVKAPISGLVTAMNGSNGDNAQQGNPVLTIVDMNSIKIKLAVDELDIIKVKAGQKAVIKFDAIEGKTYEGAVESIAQIGNASNNVTTYDVVVSVNDPSGIRLGMNANVTIMIESKENALAIPVEALVENNGQKYVRVESTENSSGTTDQAVGGQGNGQTNSTRGQLTTDTGKLVAIKTGLETENYIEVTEGLNEGDKVLIKLTTSSSTTNNNPNSRNGLGGGMGGFGGDMGTRPDNGGPQRN